MTSRLAVRQFVAVLASVTALVVAVLLSHGIWQEYFGAGPPYYARTTNMDKWTNPWPELALINLVALAILIAGARAARRR